MHEPRIFSLVRMLACAPNDGLESVRVLARTHKVKGQEAAVTLLEKQTRQEGRRWNFSTDDIRTPHTRT